MRTTILSAALAACILAAAPAEAQAGKPAASAKDPRGAAEKITYYLWDDPTYRMIVDAFNASQAEIRVDARYLPAAEYEARLPILLAGGVEMDAYMQKDMSRVFPDLANGFIEPLDAYFARTGAERAAVDAWRDCAVVGGAIVGVPFRGAGAWTYFNRKLFAAAGVPSPDAWVASGDWTWARFREVARGVTNSKEGVYGALIYTWGSQQVIPAHQRGTPFIDEAGKPRIDPSVAKSFKLRKGMESEGSLWPLLELKLTKTHYSKAFMDGKAAMIIVGDQVPGQLAKGRADGLFKGFSWSDWGIARIPCDEPTYRSFGNPTMNHVSAASRHKEAAFRFIAWMAGLEGARIVAEAGFLPAVMSPAIRAAVGKNVPDPASLDAFVEPVRVMPQFYTPWGSSVDGLVSRLMEDYLSGRLADPEIEPRLTRELAALAATRR